MPEVFTFLEAQALQGYRLYATQDVTDEHGRMLIPAGSLSVVIGLRPTVCPSVASRNLLLYQSLPISIPYRYALLRRRKDDTGVDTAARGIVA